MTQTTWTETVDGWMQSPARDVFRLADQIALDPHAEDPTPYVQGPTPGEFPAAHRWACVLLMTPQLSHGSSTHTRPHLGKRWGGGGAGDEEEYSRFNLPRRQTTVSPSRYAEFGPPLVPQRLRRHGDPENKRSFALGEHPSSAETPDELGVHVSDPEDSQYSDTGGGDSRTLVGLHESYIIDPPPLRKASSISVFLVRIPLPQNKTPTLRVGLVHHAEQPLCSTTPAIRTRVCAYRTSYCT